MVPQLQYAKSTYPYFTKKQRKEGFSRRVVEVPELIKTAFSYPFHSFERNWISDKAAIEARILAHLAFLAHPELREG